MAHRAVSDGNRFLLDEFARCAEWPAITSWRGLHKSSALIRFSRRLNALDTVSSRGCKAHCFW